MQTQCPSSFGTIRCGCFGLCFILSGSLDAMRNLAAFWRARANDKVVLVLKHATWGLTEWWNGTGPRGPSLAPMVPWRTVEGSRLG